MGKGSAPRKENTKQVQENLGNVKYGTFKPTDRDWETLNRL